MSKYPQNSFVLKSGKVEGLEAARTLEMEQMIWIHRLYHHRVLPTRM